MGGFVQGRGDVARRVMGVLEVLEHLPARGAVRPDDLDAKREGVVPVAGRDTAGRVPDPLALSTRVVLDGVDDRSGFAIDIEAERLEQTGLVVRRNAPANASTKPRRSSCASSVS